MSPVSSNTSSAGTHSGISRRTLVKGAAWSVPVLMMAAPTPAFAASGVCDPTFALNGSSYKCPGQGQNIKQYYLDICVSNLSGCSGPSDQAPTAAYIWGVKNQSGKQLVPGGGAPWPIKIELSSGAGCSGLIEFVWPAGESGSSANWLYFLYNFTDTSSNGATWSDQVVAPPNGTDQQCNPPAGLTSVASANLVTNDSPAGDGTDGSTVGDTGSTPSGDTGSTTTGDTGTTTSGDTGTTTSGDTGSTATGGTGDTTGGSTPGVDTTSGSVDGVTSGTTGGDGS